MKLTFDDEKKHPNYNSYLKRLNCKNDKGFYSVLFWDNEHEVLTVSRHRTYEAADRKFRTLLVKAQKQCMDVHLLVVSDDDYEVQRASIECYS